MRHELVCAMQAIVPVQLHDGSKAFSTLLTSNGTAFHRKVDTAQTRVEFPLATRVTTQHLTPVTRLSMCHQVAPRQVRVAAQLAEEETTLSAMNIKPII